MLDLTGKVAVVTGAGRGLGRAVAIGLAGRGAKSALIARNETQLHETAQAIQAAGGVAISLPGDISRPEVVESIQEFVAAHLGVTQILINAAGIFGPIQLIQDSDPHRWIETLAINTIGPYLTCRAFAQGMIDLHWGRIINFSSAAAFHPPGPLNSAYGTSKVALNHLTRHLAAELATTGVTANAIHPGEVKTEMWATIRSEAQPTGPIGEGFRAWAEQVGQSGGDPPLKAVDLVLELIDDKSADVNGQFLWIADGIQRPLPSW